MRHRGLVAAFAGMEMVWLWAWADFMMTATAGRPAPLIPLIAVYWASYGLTAGFRAVRFRYLWMTAAHALLIWAAVSWAAAVADCRMPVPRGSAFHWYQFGLTALLTGLFWYKGLKLTARPMTYPSVCHHFDLGIALFFALFLVQLLIWYKTGESMTHHPPVMFWVAGFFFLGLSALFLSNVPTIRKKHYIEGFRGIGVLVGFCLVFLICGMGLSMILMPLLISAAETGYEAARQAARPFGPYAVAFLKWALTSPAGRSTETSPDSGSALQDPFNVTLPEAPGSLPDWASWFFFTVMASGLVVFLGIAIRQLFGFLMKKPGYRKESKGARGFWLDLLLMATRFKKRIKDLVSSWFVPVRTAEDGFRRLTAWGRKSGVRRRQTETAHEYADRLCEVFGLLEPEIRTVVSAFTRETYGLDRLTAQDRSGIITALKKMGRPAFWGLRIRAFRTTRQLL